MSGMAVCSSKALGHAREPEFVEQVEGGLAKHDRQDSFPFWEWV